MIIDSTRYIMYGMTPEMLQCVKNACSEFKNHSLAEVLDSIANNPTFNQSEINIILFEIGRRYEKGKC